jgi:hypothetical protein
MLGAPLGRDSRFDFLIPGDATGGRIAVLRSTMPEGFSPPRHIHVLGPPLG